LSSDRVIPKGKYYYSYREREAMGRVRSFFDEKIAKSRAKIESERGDTPLKDYEKFLLRESREKPELKDDIYERLLMSNMPLVFSYAERAAAQHRELRISIEDIVSAGAAGFLVALDRFSFTKGKNTRIGNYALFYVRDAIKDAVAELTPGISIPYYVFQQKRTYSNIPDELADRKTKRQKRYYEDMYERCMSFAREQEDENELSGGEDCVLTKIERSEETDLIIRTFRKILTAQEFDILKLRFGLCGESILSVKEISEQAGLSVKDLRELIEGALVKLRESGDAKDLFRALYTRGETAA